MRLGLAHRRELIEDRLLERLARPQIAQDAGDQHAGRADQQQNGKQLRGQPESRRAEARRRRVGRHASRYFFFGV
jgi:hypothetical protein